MQAYDVGLLWGGLVTYNASVSDDMVEAYTAWTDDVKNYPNGSVIPFWSYDPTVNGGSEVVLVAYEDINGVEEPEAFNDFLGIPEVIASSMRLDSHKNITDELEIAPGYR